MKIRREIVFYKDYRARLRVRVEKGYLGLAFRRSLSWDINTPAFLRPLAIRP